MARGRDLSQVQQLAQLAPIFQSAQLARSGQGGRTAAGGIPNVPISIGASTPQQSTNTLDLLKNDDNQALLRQMFGTGQQADSKDGGGLGDIFGGIGDFFGDTLGLGFDEGDLFGQGGLLGGLGLGNIFGGGSDTGGSGSLFDALFEPSFPNVNTGSSGNFSFGGDSGGGGLFDSIGGLFDIFGLPAFDSLTGAPASSGKAAIFSGTPGFNPNAPDPRLTGGVPGGGFGFDTLGSNTFQNTGGFGGGLLDFAGDLFSGGSNLFGGIGDAIGGLFDFF